MNLWSHRFSQNMNQILQEFLPCTMAHTTGQKSLQFLVHILGEMMTSSIHSEIYWPLANKCGQKMCTFFIDLCNLCLLFSLLIGSVRTKIQMSVFVVVSIKKENMWPTFMIPWYFHVSLTRAIHKWPEPITMVPRRK